MTPHQSQSIGPRPLTDSSIWWRSFCGRYQSLRATVRAMQLETETKRPPVARRGDFAHAVACLDAAFDALNAPAPEGKNNG